MDKIESLLQDKRRLYIFTMVVGILLISLFAFFLYRVGIQRGQSRTDSDFQTRIAQLPAAERTAQLAVIAAQSNQSADGNAQTEAATATPTATPTERPTPTQTTTPESVDAWAERFQTRATDGLNALVGPNFTAEHAESLVRRLAQDHGLVFVLASYFVLESDEWAALVVPRTQDGVTLPFLFWRDPNDQNRVRSQALRTRLSESAQARGNQLVGEQQGDAAVRTTFRRGLSTGLLRMDQLGRFQLLLIENAAVDAALSVFVLGQPTPAADFDILWWSQNDSEWPIQGDGSQYELVESDAALLPSLEIIAALMPYSSLRDTLNAPSLFLEKPPFAQQKTRTMWIPRLSSGLDGRGAASVGYQLTTSELLLTPLTTFSRFLTLLQEDNLIAAGDYTTRLDLLQQAFDLELTAPAIWLGFYLDADDQPLFDGRVTETLRFFDNNNRSRTFNAVFVREEGEPYRLASLQTLLNVYEAEDLITPVGGSLQVASSETPEPARSSSESAFDPAASGANSVANETGNTAPGNTAPGNTAPLSVRSLALTATAQSEASVAGSTPFVPTATEPVLVPTPVPTETPTVTPTATETATDLPTETPTPIGLPAVLPAIPPNEVGLVSGSIGASLSNLRGGPSTEYERVAQLDLGDPVEYFGISETGDWLLLRVNKPDSPNHGALGWISITLVYWNSDISILPRYFSNGLPVVPFTPSPTATPTETPDPSIPTVVPTPTPRTTAEVRQPETNPQSGTIGPGADVPSPEEGELSVVVGGDTIPANGDGIVDVSIAGGQRARLDIQNATIEIWSGLFGQAPGEWILAPADLLWGGTELSVLATASTNDLTLLIASRVRIVQPPIQDRAEVLFFPSLAESVEADAAMGLLGSSEESGVYLLTSVGTLQQILVNEQDANWVDSQDTSGLLLQTPSSLTGRNSFSWARTDGTGLLVTAQPFHMISGVAGDGTGDIWWIETPQVDLDQWELWQYDPFSASISLRLRSSGELLRHAENIGDAPISDSVVPLLLSASASDDGQQLSLLIDSVDRAQQQIYTGLFTLELEAVELAEQLNVRSARLLLADGGYRGPLRLNPEQTQLAYFIYDSSHPSLTSGFITPANRLNLLMLTGAGAGTSQTIYETQTAAEFLAPQVVWRNNSTLVVARSRFAGDNVFSMELFGLVEIRLAEGVLQEQTLIDGSSDANVLANADEIVVSTHLLTDGQRILDFTACRDGLYTLLLMQNGEGAFQVGRWGGKGRPRPLFGVPVELTSTFICWHAPVPS